MGTIKKPAVLCLTVVILTFVLFPVSTLAEKGKQAVEEAFPQIVILVLDRVMLEDLMTYSGPFLQSIMEKSGAALMSVNTAVAPGTDSGYLSMGSGARLSGNWTTGKAYNRDEWTGDVLATALYRRHSGFEAVPDGEVIHVYTGVMKGLNQERPYPFFIGLMGESLKAKGFDAAVLGNADTDTKGRQAAVMAMDAAGSVSYGDVSTSMLRNDDRFPFGIRSDAEAYAETLKRVYDKARLIVVDWGDTKRINAYLSHLPDRRRGELLQETFRELDIFLSEAVSSFSTKTRLLIVSPSHPGGAVSGGQQLTPVIYYDLQHPGPGKLTSDTTRRAGIVTSIDIAPTVLSFLELSSPVFLWGAPLRVIPDTEPLSSLASVSRDTRRIYTQRAPLIRGYILTQIIILLWGVGGLLSRHRFFHLSKYGLYSLLGFPIAVVLSPVFPFFPAHSVYLNAAFLLVITLIIVFLAFTLFRCSERRLSFLALLTFSILVLDLFGGTALNSRSFLGYDPIAGARFYGIGNEYMGIMVGSFLFGFLSLGASKNNQEEGITRKELGCSHVLLPGFVSTLYYLVLFCGLGLLLVFLMASPRYGANFGGAITSGVGVGFACAGLLTRSFPFLLRRKTFYFNGGWIFLLFVLMTGVFIFFFNTRMPGEAVSHLGRTWELVQNNGLDELVNVITRKAEMNIKLLRYSIWSRIFLVLVALVAVLTFYPAGFMKKIFRRYPFFKIALGGIIAGSITALLVNDSGVVAAATTMLYGVVPLLVMGKH